jgi:hypothetical protein
MEYTKMISKISSNAKGNGRSILKGGSQHIGAARLRGRASFADNVQEFLFENDSPSTEFLVHPHLAGRLIDQRGRDSFPFLHVDADQSPMSLADTSVAYSDGISSAIRSSPTHNLLAKPEHVGDGAFDGNGLPLLDIGFWVIPPKLIHACCVYQPFGNKNCCWQRHNSCTKIHVQQPWGTLLEELLAHDEMEHSLDRSEYEHHVQVLKLSDSMGMERYTAKYASLAHAPVRGQNIILAEGGCTCRRSDQVFIGIRRNWMPEQQLRKLLW